MGMIEKTSREIQDEVNACKADGTAFDEWTTARDLDDQELIRLAQRESQGLEEAALQGVAAISLTGIILSSFRLGYEVAVRKERANFL